MGRFVLHLGLPNTRAVVIFLIESKANFIWPNLFAQQNDFFATTDRRNGVTHFVDDQLVVALCGLNRIRHNRLDDMFDIGAIQDERLERQSHTMRIDH